MQKENAAWWPEGMSKVKRVDGSNESPAPKILRIKSGFPTRAQDVKLEA